MSSTTFTTKNCQWPRFNNFCTLEGHVAIPAAVGTIRAYIGFLYEEGRVHAASIDHYISAVRSRHLRASQPGPCSGQTQRDLLRAFRRQDDARGEHRDIRAALPATVVSLIRQCGLMQTPESISERDAALIEFQYLLSWRASTCRTVQLQDVEISTSISGPPPVPLLILSARPRNLKGRAIRGPASSSLTCKGPVYTNPFSSAVPLFLSAIVAYCVRPILVFKWRSTGLPACNHALTAHPAYTSC